VFRRNVSRTVSTRKTSRYAPFGRTRLTIESGGTYREQLEQGKTLLKIVIDRSNF
jgi:hypothetical protein